jgi:hypothetical protein
MHDVRPFLTFMLVLLPICSTLWLRYLLDHDMERKLACDVNKLIGVETVCVYGWTLFIHSSEGLGS